MTAGIDPLEHALRVVLERASSRPEIGLVLGSGWGSFAASLNDATRIAYSEIPGFPEPGVAGHVGQLVLGRIGRAPVAVLQGRFHYYEGHSLATTTLPVRLLARLGVRRLILTAAVGGIRPDLQPGDFVCLTDHLNLLGHNPLRGPHEDPLGPRFPDMSQVYDPRLRSLATEAAAHLGIPLLTGVYAAMPGPSYETPAEIRMLRTLGADVVGMSVVPEAIVARQMGVEVLGLALVSNAAAGVSAQPIDHAEVLAAGRAAAGRIDALLRAIVESLEGPNP
jgi:purine-nucleoside phosphorylase